VDGVPEPGTGVELLRAGVIWIELWLSPDGNEGISLSLEPDDITVMTALGALQLAQDSLLHHSHPERDHHPEG
jgi:hypothetical protein